MTRTPDEIKKGLEYLSITDVEQKLKAAKKGLPYAYVEEVASDALALIQQLEARNNTLYHTLIGVMHFVDKWLEDAGYDPESDPNGSIAINRAAKAREIALRAIEEAENRPPF